MLKNLLFACLSCIFITAGASAQHTGVYGSLFAGPFYSYGKGLSDELKVNGINSANLSLNKLSHIHGASISVITSPQIVFGTHGYNYQFTSENENGKAKVSTTALFVHTAYCFLNNKNWVAFPYLGMGAHFTKTNISNSTANKVFSLADDIITSGESSSYKNTGLATDFGLSVKYFNLKKIINCKTNSVFIGLDAGTSFFFNGKWQNVSTENEISFANDPLIVASYLRFNIGMKL